MSMLAVIAAMGGGGDKTPDAVNWADVSGIAPQSNANQTISGINTTITLEANFTGSGLLLHSKNGGSFESIANGGQVSVVNGDTLRWQVTLTPPNPVSGTVTITNESDGSAILDTFTYNLTLI